MKLLDEKSKRRVNVVIGPGQEKVIALKITDPSRYCYSYKTDTVIEDA